MKKSSHKGVYWRTQLPVDYLDISLVINTWETVIADLSGGKPARLWYIIIEQTNNGATAEDLELEITINGTAYTITIPADSGTPYYVTMLFSLVAGDFSFEGVTASRSVGDPVTYYKAMPFVGVNVGLIRIRQTTDVDITSAQIEVNIIWDRLEP